MMQTPHNPRKILRIVCILFVTVGLVSALPMNVIGQDTLTLSLNRNVGLGLGSYISGTFTLHGTGPDTIQNLTVYFNEVEVHFVTGNTISWQFNTGNYESGATNITLIGIDESGTPHFASRMVVFVSDALNNMIYIGIVAIVGILCLAKYGPKLMRLRKK
ncbi:MAG: hypothetical protein KAU48_03845 [Candidatus Thorarchaeota archaeon]|nr:hypothetical protein [Candidatus Thorarchaeota archaeon]